MQRKISHVQCVARFGAFTTPIVSIATTADGTLLAIAPGEGDVELWDVVTGNCMCTIPIPNSVTIPSQRKGKDVYELDEVSSLALSDDGLFLAASFRKSGHIYVWTFEGDFLAKIDGDAGFTRTVSFLPHTSLLIIALRDTRLQLWDATTQHLSCLLPGIGDKHASLLSKTGRFYSVACAPDGSQIVLDPTDKHDLVCVWDVKHEGGTISCENQTAFAWGEGLYLSHIQYRQDTTQLYHIKKKHIEGYDTKKRDFVTSIQCANVIPMSFCFSSQGDLLAFSDYEGLVYLWDMKRNLVLFQFDSRELVTPSYLYYDRSVQSMAWLSQSNLLATAGLKTNDVSGKTTVKLWQFT